MPLTKKGEKILQSLMREYGAAKGRSVFYAGIKSGRFKGAESTRARHKAKPEARRKNGRKRRSNKQPKTARQAAGLKRSSIRKDKKATKKRTGGLARQYLRKQRGRLEGVEFRPMKTERKFKAPTKRRRRNPAMEAEAALYELFHGRPPERLIQHDELIEIRSSFAELGKLLELRFKMDGRTIPITEFGNCQVVATADGRNIYFLGGKQHIDLSTLEMDSDKDLIELGPCVYISYFSRKGFHDFEPVDYFHKFGEEDGITPTLAYDQLNRKLFLIGGNYKVESAGIVN